MQAAIKAEEAAKAAAEAEAAAIAQAEAQAKVEAETLVQIEATARAEAEAAARAQLAQQAEPEYVDEDEHTGTDATDAHVTSDQQVASAAPSFLSDDAPLVLTSSQRVADTVSASAKVAADLQPSTQGTSDNSASLPSFLAVGATANNDVSLLEDVPDEEAAQAEDLVVQSPAIPDEAVLRELIRDVVQEELQGELGDRITRNLRKLIRREITSMLSQGAKD